MPMEECERWRHEATFPAEPASVSRARAFVCRNLLHQRLWHLVDPVRVVASELATTAVTGAGSSFTITLWETGSRVYVAVRDGPSPGVREGSAEPGARHRSRLTVVALLSQDHGERPDGHGGSEVWASFATTPVPA